MVAQECKMPKLPPRQFGSDVSLFRQRLILWHSQKWVNGTTLRYAFMEEYPLDSANRDLVRKGAEAWVDAKIGLKLVEITDSREADIRIAGIPGDGAWSYLGRQNWQIPKSEPTMNYGWDLRLDSRKHGVAIHEFGHALGYPHEHQSPFAGIEWDREAVYTRYGGSPNNWDKDTVDFNILDKWSSTSVVGSEWDAESIMQYGFGAGLIVSPQRYRNGIFPPGDRLSDVDIERARIDYPRIGADAPELTPMELESLFIEPGYTKTFKIEPAVDMDANLQTIGNADTVLVLQEVNDYGETEFVTGDDDSGIGRNSHVQAKLKAGHEYRANVRLFSPSQSGDAGLVLW